MNKFVTAALAAAVLGSAAQADPGDSDWLELDSEINNLASSLGPAQDGSGWSALIRANYTLSTDDIATGVGGSDVAGFELDDVDLAFWGSVGDYGWRIGFDVDGNTGSSLMLEDALVYWDCGELFTATMGQFKPRVVQSGYVDPGNQIMIDRTVLGALFDFWDMGVGAAGAWENINWSASYHNGADGDTNDSLYVGRAELVMGEAAGSSNLAALTEGALGGSEELSGTAGAAIVHDDSLGGGLGSSTSVFFDINGNVGPIGFGGEIGALGNLSGNVGIPVTSPDFSNQPLGLTVEDSSTPWALTGSYLLSPEFEVSARFQDLDNGMFGDNTIFSLGVSWYQSEHNAKWMAGWSLFDASSGMPDGSIFQVGVVVGASR